MRPFYLSLSLCLTLFLAASPVSAQQTWDLQQRQVLAAIERLSAATAPDGGGPDAYAATLADDFSRWTLGSDVVNDKQSWVEGMRSWWNDGWRVADREAKVLEIRVSGDHAFTRRIVTETYVGPEGDRSTSSSALAEVWLHGADGWLLQRVDIHPVEGS